MIVVPIGFISDHMEVLWDLDIEAAATAERLGLGFRRVPTPGVAEEFIVVLPLGYDSRSSSASSQDYEIGRASCRERV